jgi:prepilin-type N-terminal cleavage/methylation domain-containing protein/prepilin-type processing-associated H-X9-DG protein
MISRINRTRRASGAFTLIELLIVVAIIGMLVALTAPAIENARERAESTKCLTNLRNIGVAVLSYVADNDNRFPIIETDPSNPVYDPSEEAGTLLTVLGEYGVTEQGLRCPTDLRTFDNFKKRGSSYEWRPMLDDELASSPVIFTRRGLRYPPLSRIRLVMDFEPVHRGRPNLLFADGRVRTK